MGLVNMQYNLGPKTKPWGSPIFGGQWRRKLPIDQAYQERHDNGYQEPQPYHGGLLIKQFQ